MMKTNKKKKLFSWVLTVFSLIFLCFTFVTSNQIEFNSNTIKEDIYSSYEFRSRIEEIMLQMIHQRNQELNPNIDLANSFLKMEGDIITEYESDEYNGYISKILGNTIEEDNICAVLVDETNKITIYRNLDESSGFPNLSDKTNYQAWFKISLSRFGTISQSSNVTSAKFLSPKDWLTKNMPSLYYDDIAVKEQGELTLFFAIPNKLSVDNDVLVNLMEQYKYYEAENSFKTFMWVCYIAWIAFTLIFILKEEHPVMEEGLRRCYMEVRVIVAIVFIVFLNSIPEQVVYSYLYPYGESHELLLFILFFVVNLLMAYALEFWCIIGWREGFSSFFGKSFIVKYSNSIMEWIKNIFQKIYDIGVREFQLDSSERTMHLLWIFVGANIIALSLLMAIFGWIAPIIYSLILYWFMIKISNRINHDYMVLQKNTRRMSEGKLNVEITENMGLFEPIRYLLEQIREGFLKSINEETRSERMKNELISNVSHDLKTPLTSLISYIDLLKNEKDEEKQKEYITILERQSMRLKSLIESLFEVSKANSGNVKLDIMDVDLVALINQAMFEMSPQIEASGLQFKCDFDEPKIIMPLDSEKTYRIIENLISNAIKYSLEGSRVYLRVLDQSNRVIISMRNVSKNEIDFDPNDIVERFVRGDSSRHSEGSGLGLAIAKGFAEAQNGSLQIRTDGDYFQVLVTFRKSDINNQKESV